jgi:hypothetical protein
MKTYVLFDKKTGKIVHTHTEAALSGEALPVSKEELVAAYSRPTPGQKADPKNIDVIDVDRELLRRGISNRKDLYVDVEKRALSERPKTSA